MIFANFNLGWQKGFFEMEFLQSVFSYSHWLILILLFLVAFLYSTVGHGGASGYLSVMAVVGVSTLMMKPTALLLNIFVSGIAFFHFFKAGYFRLGLILPFAASSIPAAFLGGYIAVEPEIYRKALGATLIIPAFRNIFKIPPGKDFSKRDLNLTIALISGAAIGLLSGMIGIGGGILLSPLILLLNWANMKETACASALFIFVNSLAGLSGLFSTGYVFTSSIIPYILAAVCGGLLGAYFGSNKFNTRMMGYFLSIVLMLASIKLMFF
jgi:uncharacterized protein